MQRRGGGNSKALLGLASFLSFSLNLISSMWLSLITYSKESSLQYSVLFLRINYLFLHLFVSCLSPAHTLLQINVLSLRTLLFFTVPQ